MSGVYTGFYQTGRKLWRSRNPCGRKKKILSLHSEQHLKSKHRPDDYRVYDRSGGSGIPDDQTGRNSGRADHGLLEEENGMYEMEQIME